MTRFSVLLLSCAYVLVPCILFVLQVQAASSRGSARRDNEAYSKTATEPWRNAAAEAESGHDRRLEVGGVSSTVSYAGSEAEADSDFGEGMVAGRSARSR